ncbi:hypothetical protein SH661x_003081 [Planctomicrobium sp. SH661]|uniref:hypothetical protein n=1 Tax=Planctomicrobium sp. SH661 TaxID=3448124 RepID=UPI003F5C2D23
MTATFTVLDMGVVAIYIALAAAIGAYFSRRAGQSQESFFTAEQSLPWYIIALTTSTAVMGGLPIALSVYYTHGVAYRWIVDTQFMVFIPFVSVFLSPLWRRLNLKSTPEFFKCRYGDGDRSSRLFRTSYGLFMAFGWGTLLMGYVIGYTVQSLVPVFGAPAWAIVIGLILVTLLGSTISGFYGVAYVGVLQFAFYAIAFAASVPILISAAGGWDQMFATLQQNNPEFLNPLPGGKAISWTTWSVLLIQSLFLGVHPNYGEGFVAQRFLAARNAAHAKVGLIVSCVLSSVCFLLPTGLLAVAITSLYPGLSGTEAQGIYSRLLAHLPPGVFGLLIVGEAAIIIGTIDSLANWGASVMTNDVYRLQLAPHASDRNLVFMGKLFGLLMLTAGSLIGLLLVNEFFSWFMFINTATMTFLLPLGFFRFFWWRMNIWGEIVAIVIGIPFCVVVWFFLGGEHWEFWKVFVTLFGTGSVVITAAALLTPPTKSEVLDTFYRTAQPPGFWGPFRKKLEAESNGSVQIPGIGWSDLREFFVTMAAFGSLFLSINCFLGGRWEWATFSICGFVLFGSIVVWNSVRALSGSETDTGLANAQAGLNFSDASETI